MFDYNKQVLGFFFLIFFPLRQFLFAQIFAMSLAEVREINLISVKLTTDISQQRFKLKKYSMK